MPECMQTTMHTTPCLFFLEKLEFGGTVDTAKTDGRRFIDGMSKAFLQCTPTTRLLGYFICGMAPLDSDDPCYGIILCDTSLDCETHVEAEFYISGIEPSRKEICCHCTGVCDSPIELSSSLKAPNEPYSVVLPICKARLDDSCNNIVRAAILGLMGRTHTTFVVRVPRI